MLNRLLMSAAVEGLNSEKRKPFVNFDHCSNRLQRRFPCTICIDGCPSDAISQDKTVKIDENKCIGCYLCSGACPTGCISTQPSFIKNNQATQHLVISCEPGDDRLLVPCLASLPWTAYAYYSYHHPICLDLTNCQQCLTNSKPVIVEVTERLKTFWGEAYEEKIKYNPDQFKQPVSRRDFFSRFSKPLKNAQVAIEAEEINTDFASRGLFRGLLLDNLNQEFEHGWITPKVEHICWGCQICEKVCPNKAVKLTTDKKIIFDGLECTGCGVCSKICPEGAINGYTSQTIKAPHAKISYPVNSKACTDCGRLIRPTNENDCCDTCLRIRKRRGKA